MKILYITSKPVYPAYDGGSLAMQRFLKTLLHAGADVKHLTISTQKHPFVEEAYPDDLSAAIRPEAFFVDTRVKPLPALIHLFQSGSYNVKRFYVKSLAKRIKECLSEESYDGVILESLFTTGYLNDIRSLFQGKVAVRTHNVEGDLWKGYVTQASGLKKWYLKRLTRDICTYEQKVLNQVDDILSISEADSTQLKVIGVKTAIHEVPVAIDAQNIPHDYTSNALYHLGSMDWLPNRESMERLLHLLPSIRMEKADATLAVVGTNAKNYYESSTDQGVKVLGFVADLDEFLKQQGILLAPILSGSGIRIKILEAMGYGIPVVTTSIGALGIPDENYLIIADSDELFVQKTLELLHSEDARKEIGTNAINYIRKKHNIEAISQTIIEIFHTT